MNGGAMPPALLAAALGFALAFAPRRIIAWSVTVFVAAAVATARLPLPKPWETAVFAGLWVSVALTAASVHWRGGPPLALALAANAGLWSGATVSFGAGFTVLAAALPPVLLALPGAWLVARGGGLAIKVVASWLIAVALLAAALPMVATPGYVADHRE